MKRERQGRRKRSEKSNLYYIILLCLYYFIGLYVKIRIEMLGVLLNRLVK